MLIDVMCSEELFNYLMSLYVGGFVLGGAGLLLIASVLVAPDLPNFGGGRGETLNT